jgi:Orn/Lys/Arg decarboxylase, major domain
VFLVAYSEDLERERDGLLADVVRGLIYPEEDGRTSWPSTSTGISRPTSNTSRHRSSGASSSSTSRPARCGRARATTAACSTDAARSGASSTSTSASNKIATGALVSGGDLVLFDRNSHKSMHHGALVLGGGIPVYLPADRNPQGLIGPIDPGALEEDRIRAAIRDCPLVNDPDRWRARRPFRLAVIEQCSYDGTIYNVRAILDRIGHLCEYVLFDEAWAGFMKFHPLFAGHYAMGLDGLGPEDPGIIATQSTHKQAGRLLPGLADPPEGPAHRRPAAARDRAALQRGLPAARLDIPVLSAVLLPRRGRPDDERPQRFEQVTDGYAMTDPSKLTLVTPGFSRETGDTSTGASRPRSWACFPSRAKTAGSACSPTSSGNSGLRSIAAAYAGKPASLFVFRVSSLLVLLSVLVGTCNHRAGTLAGRGCVTARGRPTRR